MLRVEDPAEALKLTEVQGAAEVRGAQERVEVSEPVADLRNKKKSALRRRSV
jgi:hypothetical protein